MLLSGGAREDSRDPLTIRSSNQSILRKSIPDIHWKDWCWSSNTLATWCKEPTHWKRPDAGIDWGQKEKGLTEDEMVEWHHQLNRHEFEQIPGVSEGKGSLAGCSPWGLKELYMTEQLNNRWRAQCHLGSILAKIFNLNLIKSLELTSGL